MKKVLFAMLALVLALGLALPMATPVKAISWGEKDTTPLYPNVGAVVVDIPYQGYYDPPPLPVASGVLIEERVFLTAGHVVAILEGLVSAEEIQPEWVKVNFDVDASNQATLLEVSSWYKHTSFGMGGRGDFHDLGVLILTADAPVTAETLPDVGFLDDLGKKELRDVGGEEAKFTVVGYGATLNFPPPTMDYTNTERWVAESEYQKLLKAQLLLSQNHAKNDEIGGTCYGDSGGPVFYDGTLVAVTSWGDQRCVATGFCYRVDTAESLGWIDSVLNP